MKKILLSLFVAVLGLTATSCTKEYREVVLESSGTRVSEFTVHIDEWEVFGDPDTADSRNYYYYTYEWDVLTDHVVYDGNVNAYVYNEGRQNALPYTYPVTVQFDDGTTGIAGEALSYDFEPGKVTIIMQDLDGWMPQLTLADRPMTFRIVATAPINYIIEQ